MILKNSVEKVININTLIFLLLVQKNENNPIILFNLLILDPGRV